MKRRDFVRLSGVGAGALLTSLYGCEPIPGIEDDPVDNPIDSVGVVNPVEPSYGNFTNRIISSGLERPSGISLYGKSSKKSSSNPSSLEDIVFCSAPLFDANQSKFFVKPKIFNYQGDLNTINTIYEFGNEDVGLFQVSAVDPILDSIGNPIFIDGEMVWRPRGINSDTAVLTDSTILFSTMMSNKILDLTGGIKNIYLENDDLIGINNMVYGIDKKLYFTQVAIKEENGQIIRPKRVASLDSNKNLNVEFELPSNQEVFLNEFIASEKNSLYANKYLETGSQVRIIENLDTTVDPSKFYIMDQISRSIYKFSNKGELVNLLEGSSPEVYPSGIAAEINGKVYYVTSPVLYHPSNPNLVPGKLAFNPELRVLDPKKGEDNLFYTFEEPKPYTYQSGTGYLPEIEINGEKYLMPVNFLMTLGAVQVDNNLNLYYTDNIAGDVGELSSSAQ